jgi:hypothetical protein
MKLNKTQAAIMRDLGLQLSQIYKVRDANHYITSEVGFPMSTLCVPTAFPCSKRQKVAIPQLVKLGLITPVMYQGYYTLTKKGHDFLSDNNYGRNGFESVGDTNEEG